MVPWRTLAVTALAALVHPLAGNSVHIAQLCRGKQCNDPRFPLLDYSPEKKKCTCVRHPCWNDKGVRHRCKNKEFPFLRFEHHQNGTLKCKCSKYPFVDSVHVSKDLCPGFKCEGKKAPLLDYDSKNKTCKCRQHPCLDEKLMGSRYVCKDPELPILRYREGTTGKKKKQCDCVPLLEPPSKQEL